MGQFCKQSAPDFWRSKNYTATLDPTLYHRPDESRAVLSSASWHGTPRGRWKFQTHWKRRRRSPLWLSSRLSWSRAWLLVSWWRLKDHSRIYVSALSLSCDDENIPIESISPYYPSYPMLLCYLVCDNVWYGYGSNIEEISGFTVPLEATHIWTIGPLDRCAQGGRHLCSHSYRWHWYVPWSWCSACPLPSVLNTVCTTCITCITCTFGLKILKASRIWNVSTLDVLGRLMIARAFPGSGWRADVRAGTGRSATLMSSSRWICGDQSTG